MQDLSKIAGLNLLGLLIYMLIINVSATGQERGLQVVALAAFAITFHVALNVLLAIIFFVRKKTYAKYYLLSAVMVLVIGFSACLGSTAIV